MSTQSTSGTTPQSSTSGAAAVGQEARGAASQVAGTATEEARNVARETTDQARQLLQQARSDLTDQASSQQDRAAQGLRQLSDQLSSMAGNADSDGMARTLVDDVARRAGDAASFLEGRDPGALLEEVRSFARRRPGAFLLAAAGLGLAAGRMSRSVVDEKREEHQSSEFEGAPTGSFTTSATGPTSMSPMTGTSTAGTSTADIGLVGSGSSTATTGPAGAGYAATTTADALPAGDSTLSQHHVSQPLEADGTFAEIDDDGRLTEAGDNVVRGDR